VALLEELVLILDDVLLDPELEELELE